MHLQKYTLFDLELGVKATQNVAQYPLHHVTYASAKFEVALFNNLRGDAFTRNTLLDLHLGSRSHKMLHHVTYALAKL